MDKIITEEGRKESRHFIYGHVSSDNERGNPLLPHELLFPIQLGFNVHIQSKLLLHTPDMGTYRITGNFRGVKFSWFGD